MSACACFTETPGSVAREGEPRALIHEEDAARLGVAEWPSLAATGHILELAAPPFAQRLGFLAYRKFRNGDTTDALSLDANYVRRSDAEVFWKGNKSALKA